MATPHALAAKSIRTQLKAIGVKAKVTSESFSMGNAVRVSCTDLSKEVSDKVKAICKAHQYGSFDGMTDMYEDDNRNESLQQVKYVTFSENISDERKQAIWEGLRAELLPNNENLPEDYTQNSGSYVNSEGETIGLLVRRAFFERRV